MYLKVFNNHMNKARRAVAIKLKTGQCKKSIYDILKLHGTINNVVEVVAKKKKCYLYVEYKNPESVDDLIKATSMGYSSPNSVTRFSRILRAPNVGFSNEKFSCKLHTLKQPVFTKMKGLPLVDQMAYLYDHYKMRDFDLDIRAFICTELQELLGVDGYFLPFGSTVSGLGTRFSDLDIELRTALPIQLDNSSLQHSSFENKRHLLKTIARILKSGVSGFSHVDEILFARVPIIGFTHDMLDISCDLSICANPNDISLSQILYYYSVVVPSFPVLSCALRKWAHNCKAVLPSPTFTLTNFGLTQLILFYLQCRHGAPTLTKILSDNSVIVNLNETEALIGFFKFYSCFDFSKCGIDTKNGTTINNSDPSSLLVQNPLESTPTNITRNVRSAQANSFKLNCRKAFEHLSKTPCLYTLLSCNDYP